MTHRRLCGLIVVQHRHLRNVSPATNCVWININCLSGLDIHAHLYPLSIRRRTTQCQKGKQDEAFQIAFRLVGFPLVPSRQALFSCVRSNN